MEESESAAVLLSGGGLVAFGALTWVIRTLYQLKKVVSSDKVDSAIDSAGKATIELMQSELQKANERNEALYIKFMTVSEERNAAYQKISDLTIQVGHLEASTRQMQTQIAYLTKLITHVFANMGDTGHATELLRFMVDIEVPGVNKGVDDGQQTSQ